MLNFDLSSEHKMVRDTVRSFVEKEINKPYQAKNKIRFLTATSLFDGHNAAINVFQRIL